MWRLPPLARRPDVEVVGIDELFLTPADIATLSEQAPQPVDADLLWTLTGGWPRAVLMLLRDPHAEDAVVRAFGRAMVPWLAAIDPDHVLMEAAFLPDLSKELVGAFYGDRYSPAPGLATLAHAAIARRSPSGGWMMPALLQRALVDAHERDDPQRAEWLHQQAVLTMHGSGLTTAAVNSALTKSSWTALETILVEGWVDIFTTNPRLLLKAGRKVPRWISRRSEIYGPAMKIVSAAAKDGMVIPFPATEPHYPSDRTAQMLRGHTLELYQRPNAEAFFAGLVELGILRFHGHYGGPGVEAAQRLRAAVQQATAGGSIRASLYSMAELQAGVTLHIANEIAAAIRAYASALEASGSVGNRFIAADAASKLALASIQEGDISAARHWLDEFDGHHGKVGWGAGMVGRSSVLARGYIAFEALDFDAMQEALAQLPAEPDNDEFWSVHALLLAIRDMAAGNTTSAGLLLDTLHRTRPYAAQSPMAVRNLLHARALTAPLDDAEALLPSNPVPESITALAIRYLHAGDEQKALSIIATRPSDAGGVRYTYRVRNIRLAARHRGVPLPEKALDEVARQHRERGVLADLLLFWMTGHGRQVAARLDLRTEDVERLERFSSEPWSKDRPRLTRREHQVLAGLRAGHSRVEIAERLFVSPNTVKTQVASLYRKLDVNTKSAALETATRWGY